MHLGCQFTFATATYEQKQRLRGVEINQQSRAGSLPGRTCTVATDSKTAGKVVRGKMTGGPGQRAAVHTACLVCCTVELVEVVLARGHALSMMMVPNVENVCVNTDTLRHEMEHCATPEMWVTHVRSSMCDCSFTQ